MFFAVSRLPRKCVWRTTLSDLSPWRGENSDDSAYPGKFWGMTVGQGKLGNWNGYGKKALLHHHVPMIFHTSCFGDDPISISHVYQCVYDQSLAARLYYPCDVMLSNLERQEDGYDIWCNDMGHFFRAPSLGNQELYVHKEFSTW